MKGINLGPKIQTRSVEYLALQTFEYFRLWEDRVGQWMELQQHGDHVGLMVRREIWAGENEHKTGYRSCGSGQRLLARALEWWD